MTATDFPVGGPRAGTSEPTGGRTRIAPRALDRLASAVTADAFGSDPKKTSVELTDDGGSLSLTVECPVRVPSLDRVAADDTLVDKTGGTVLDRAAAAQKVIQSRVSELTGYQISRVSIRLTGVDLTPERRVR